MGVGVQYCSNLNGQAQKYAMGMYRSNRRRVLSAPVKISHAPYIATYKRPIRLDRHTINVLLAIGIGLSTMCFFLFL